MVAVLESGLRGKVVALVTWVQIPSVTPILKGESDEESVRNIFRTFEWIPTSSPNLLD